MLMEWLIIALLLVALIAALVWNRILRRKLREAPPQPPPMSHPPSEDYSSLFQASMEAIDVGVAIVDKHLRVRFSNRRCLELLGRRMSEIRDRSLIVLLRDPRAEALVKEAIERREERADILRPVLTRHTIDFRCVPLEQGGALLLLRDLTRLSQLERARRDLIANVSHDLRTPLTSLRLLVETLQTSPPPEVVERMLHQMQGEIDGLTTLVNKLYDLSEIESGRLILQLQPFPAGALVERAIERINPHAQQHNLTLSSAVAEDLPSILVDRDRMEQALLNLLQNAVKFTPPGGKISVVAAPATPSGSRQDGEQWVEIVVSDTGPGIPPEDLPRIFERFYKVDRSRTRGSGGMGLGLAIAKHLVEGHGGRIWAESTFGEGSSFHILLPAAK
ncbi:MAG: PAS domain-containing sensor histidine kinase [Herpetosiphonaceae bacterium]|nr:MAG: PAS domain-containing sensor histidine kinase [Herpetosiphonaceae bacterium]